MRPRRWALLAAALTACSSESTPAPSSGDASTLDGLDSTAFARVADLAPLATRAELSDLATTADLAAYATTTQLAGHPTFVDLAGYATVSELAGYARATDLADLATTADLAAYATRTQLDVAVASCVATTDARLSDARAPLAGSAAYLQNQSSSAQAASFWISGGATVGGDATVAGNLSVGGALSGRAQNAAGPPVTCGAAQAGHFYFDTSRKAFMGCDGTSWVCLGGAGGCTFRSCKEVLQAGASAGTGLYTLQGTYGPYRAYCDMVSDGGGWTLVLSSAPGATFMGAGSPSWGAEDGVDSPASPLTTDHKALAFDQVPSWVQVRISNASGTRTYELTFPAQTAPLRSVYAGGRTLVGSAVAKGGTLPYPRATCPYPVLNGSWTTTAGATVLRMGLPEPESGGGTTNAGFDCSPGDGGAGTVRSGAAAPYWPGGFGLGYSVGAGFTGFALCGDGAERSFCAPGETPRIHVWIR